MQALRQRAKAAGLVTYVVVSAYIRACRHVFLLGKQLNTEGGASNHHSAPQSIDPFRPPHPHKPLKSSLPIHLPITNSRRRTPAARKSPQGRVRSWPLAPPRLRRWMPSRGT